VNTFVVGWSRDGAAEVAPAATALERLLRALPFKLAPIAAWVAPDRRSSAAWASHEPEAVGGVAYVRADDDSLAMFSGRPIAWAGDRADGRSPLDPAHYLGPAAGWAPSLDGRAAAVSAAAGRLEVWSDPLGAYPLYVLETADACWISNNAEVLRHIADSREMDRTALASLVGGGWPLDGDPIWSRVRRLPPGLRTFGTDVAVPDPRPRLGRGLEAEAAANTLIETVRALADWPGRPNVVPVTGGRDSRVVLAAARAAGIDFTATTGGAPDDDDVRIGAELARWAGVPHERIAPDPSGDMWSRPRRSARTLMFTSAGTASLADAAGFPLAPRSGPLPLWHTGQGGEIGRAYYAARYGRSRAVRALEHAFTGRRPGRRPPLNEHGLALVRGQIDSWADEQLEAGARPHDLADLFYLTKRMGTWAGPTHGAVEWVRDSTSALWSRRVVPHLLAPSRQAREAEHFHREVLGLLAPELLELPLAGGGWRSRSVIRRRATRARRLASRSADELRTRLRPRPRPAAATEGDRDEDPFNTVRDLVANAAENRSHPVFDVLDPARVDELLASSSADTMRRYYVWRLATVLLADGE
jgi:hypothetical protein